MSLPAKTSIRVGNSDSHTLQEQPEKELVDGALSPGRVLRGNAKENVEVVGQAS
jgi:hypothetical protein